MVVSIFLGGCVLINPSMMTQENKRVVYKSIQNEIEEYKIQGEEFYTTGYYADAAKAYEMVNFYEERAVIPLSKIHSIRLKAIDNSNFHYKQAKKYLGHDTQKALIELNKMIRNNPEHIEGKALLESVKKEPKIQLILKQKEEALRQALAQDTNKIEILKKIDLALKDLSTYDEMNPLVVETKKMMKGKREVLVNEAISLYYQGSLSLAEKKFQELHAIYPYDPVCKKYLAQISTKIQFKEIMLQAKKAFQEEDYILVLSLCEKAIQYEPNNIEASQLSKNAKEQYTKQIPKLIQTGKNFYNKKDFQNAYSAFQSVLLLDARNDIALAYIKKINQQLQTIKSLR